MQKRIVVISWLFLYLLMVARPMMPILDYVINQDKIISELCIEKDTTITMCYGTCYLKIELEKSFKDSQQTTDWETKIKEINFPHSILDTDQTFDLSFLEFIETSPKLFSIYLEKRTKDYIPTLFRPPIS